MSALSKQYSSRDLPGHTKLKYREQGQSTSDELRARDFRKDLEERERTEKSSSSKRPLPPVVQRAIEQNKKQKVNVSSLDMDDPVDSENSDSDDSDDDTAALLAELNKIKRERAHDHAKKEMEKKQEEEKIRMENILSGNPLLNYSAGVKSADLKVKRRWDDDVVFKNCARSEPEKKGSNFINDSLRSEFHKKFMEKYIK